MDRESLELSKSLFHLLLCARGLSLEVLKLNSLFQTCPSVVGTAWDGFLLPKGVSSVCSRPQEHRGDNSCAMASS